MIRSLIFFILSFFAFASSAQTTNDEEHQRDQIQITEWKLANGLHVIFKQSKLEPCDFDFQLFAVGGYSSLAIADQPSGWLSAQIARESGLGRVSGDELECFLDDHSLELNISLRPFDRRIEVSGPVSELPHSLQLIHSLFTYSQFNQAGFQKAVIKARQHLLQRSKASQLIDTETFIKINLRNWHILSPFTLFDLNKIDLAKSQEIFNDCFSNPAEFTLIVVGDITPETLRQALESTLGTLKQLPLKKWQHPIPPSFPAGVTKKEFAGISRYKTSQTLMTFPLTMTQTIDPETLHLLCLMVKQHIFADPNLGSVCKNSIQVNHQFPLFPYLNPAWLTIRFSSSEKQICEASQALLKALDRMKENGFTEHDFKQAFYLMKASKPAVVDNSYDLSILLERCLTGDKIQNIEPVDLTENEIKLKLKMMKECYPNLSQFTMITFHP